jgi:hypothetical protein
VVLVGCMAREYAPGGAQARRQEGEMTKVRRDDGHRARSRANYSQPVGELYGAMKPIASISWIWPPQIL